MNDNDLIKKKLAIALDALEKLEYLFNGYPTRAVPNKIINEALQIIRGLDVNTNKTNK